MNWDSPEERLALLERIGADAYNRALAEHELASTIETVNGYHLRAVNSRFGPLVAVAGTGHSFADIERARDFARTRPAKPAQ